jgi:precorrin-6Y C5,15-methyltransferase (decarboxylating)
VLAYERLKLGGRLVAHMSTIDGLSEVHSGLHRLGPEAKVWMFHLARGTYQMERIRFESLNPSFLLSVVKPK